MLLAISLKNTGIWEDMPEIFLSDAGVKQERCEDPVEGSSIYSRTDGPTGRVSEVLGV